MTELSRLRQQAILRHAAGYVELAELLVETDKPVPVSSARLLQRALDTLDELPEAQRSFRRRPFSVARRCGRWVIGSRRSSRSPRSSRGIRSGSRPGSGWGGA